MGNNIIENSALLLSRLQGLGPRSAKRILLDLIKKKDSLLFPLINSLNELHNSIMTCSLCFNIDTSDPCNLCSNTDRTRKIICVVEDISSLWAIEKTKTYVGLYFVLGGSISAKRGYEPSSLNIDFLINRIQKEEMEEVIIATPATIEGQITANYILEGINNKDVKVSMLAQGIPVGGEIDYLDDTTIATALKSRKRFVL